jgi:hypothetical protein
MPAVYDRRGVIRIEADGRAKIGNCFIAITRYGRLFSFRGRMHVALRQLTRIQQVLLLLFVIAV